MFSIRTQRTVEGSEQRRSRFIFIGHRSAPFADRVRAGLLFIDFDTRDLLQLTGSVELLLDLSAREKTRLKADRAWRFTLIEGLRHRSASPLRWTFGEYSPRSIATATD